MQIFRLWQLYLDNVNPLLKVTHTLSLQGRIIEAAGNVSNISPTLEALMFSIYCMSILSLSVDDCQGIFPGCSSKVDLLTRYQFGCQQALLNCGFLRCDDRDCLTALYLYLVSLPSGSCRIRGLMDHFLLCWTRSNDLRSQLDAARFLSPCLLCLELPFALRNAWVFTANEA